MQGCNWFNSFVSGVWEDLGERLDYSQAYLSGWFLDTANIGLVNTQIDTCFHLTGYTGISGVLTGICIAPCMHSQEQAIFKSNFDVFFYVREGRLALSGAYSAVGSWVNLKEGDSSITRINRADLARTYNLMAKDARQALKDLVKLYLKNGAKPQSVNGNDTISAPYYDREGDSLYYRGRDWSA